MTGPATLQPGSGPIRAATYLPATTDTVLWGRLPCATDAPVLKVEPGTEVTFDTVSHEGILEDQGRDPTAFFERYGVATCSTTRSPSRRPTSPHLPGVDGPHVVSRPIAVAGARRGDLLAITVVETLPRVPYGVISNRHGRGALPGEYPRDRPHATDLVSVFAQVVSDDGDPRPAAARRRRRAAR